MNSRNVYYTKKLSHTLLLGLAFVLSMATNASDIDVSGLLTNRTITWFGQDFFSQFASEWRNSEIRGADNLLIEEVPSARKGTQIVIRYNRAIILKTSISGTRNQSRERGAQAVSFVLSRVQRIDSSAKQYSYVDISHDEL